MKKIGLFYETTTVKTSAVAKEIAENFGKSAIDVVPLETATSDDFEKYDYIIAGASTWFDGELPAYWDEVMPEIESSALKGKKAAIFGLGDQAGYPDNFADGVGILAGVFESAGAVLEGKTSVEGYTFENSRAQQGELFLGLVIDMENQPEETAPRIKKWVKQLKDEFGM